MLKFKQFLETYYLDFSDFEEAEDMEELIEMYANYRLQQRELNKS
mgnify:CR=1 FL=1